MRSLTLLATLVACSAPSLSRAPDGHDSEPPLAEGDAAAETIPDAPDPSAEIFDLGLVRSIRLDLDDEDWADIRDDPWSKNWHQADFHWEGETVNRVAVRAFGSGSVRSGKPPLKISFDRLEDGQEWRGLDELKLDNSSQDYGFLNEAIATTALRRAGLPTARTGWATVQVNGAPVGFYVVMESIDDRYVERWYGSDEGHLYSTNEHYYGRGLKPLDDPLTWYEPQTSAGGDGQDLVELTQIIASGSDAELLEVLDLAQFTHVSVARSVLGSLDAFSADGNNFYLYDHQGRWKLLPWDFDVEMGYPWYFSTALAVDPTQPWTSSPWSADCVTGEDYADPVLLRSIAMGTDIDALVQELIADPLSWERLSADVVAAAELIRPYVWDDSLGYGSYFEIRQADLRLFLHSRLSRLAEGEVADCPEPEEGVLRATDLSPSGTVSWGTLDLDSTTTWGPGFIVAGEHHCTGVFAHAASTVTLQVPEGYGSLSGASGLQDWNRVSSCGDGATFHVLQDGVALWSSDTVMPYQQAMSFGPLEVEPGTVQLVTGVNADYSCDTTAWVDLELAPE